MIIAVDPDFQRINFFQSDRIELLENCFLFLQEKSTKLPVLDRQSVHDFTDKDHCAFNLFTHCLINRTLVKRGKGFRRKGRIAVERSK